MEKEFHFNVKFKAKLVYSKNNLHLCTTRNCISNFLNYQLRNTSNMHRNKNGIKIGFGLDLGCSNLNPNPTFMLIISLIWKIYKKRGSRQSSSTRNVWERSVMCKLLGFSSNVYHISTFIMKLFTAVLLLYHDTVSQ